MKNCHLFSMIVILIMTICHNYSYSQTCDNTQQKETILNLTLKQRVSVEEIGAIPDSAYIIQLFVKTIKPIKTIKDVIIYPISGFDKNQTLYIGYYNLVFFKKEHAIQKHTELKNIYCDSFIKIVQYGR